MARPNSQPSASEHDTSAADLTAHTSRFVELVRAGRYNDLIESSLEVALREASSDPSLSLELGALRLLLQRIVASELLEGDPRTTTQTVTRIVDTTIRTLRMQRSLSTGLEDELRSAISRVFAELDLEEER